MTLPIMILRRQYRVLASITTLCMTCTLILYLFNRVEILSSPIFRSLASDNVDKRILNSTLGFEKIVVINLPSRTDRRDALSLAARFTGFEPDWIDGVLGVDVEGKHLPHGDRNSLAGGAIGSWRGHMNAIRTVVEHNLSSALILEDDVDWDMRLKSQLQTFATASRALLSDQVRTLNVVDNAAAPSPNQFEDWEKVSFPLPSLQPSPKTSLSPYGENWDVLWLGHCGTSFRSAPHTSRIIIPNDITVPSPPHLRPHPFATPDTYAALYPPHTRIVHHPANSSCSFAYAISQRGARKLLYEFGVKAFDKQFDLMLSDFCNNSESLDNHDDDMAGMGRVESEGVCITVQPPLFSHHFPKGASSDILATGGGFVKMVGTLYVRWSVRMNLGRLVRGSREMEDQWPDERSS